MSSVNYGAILAIVLVVLIVILFIVISIKCGFSWLAIIIKLLLMVAIFVFALCNYRYYSFSKGYSTVAINDDDTFDIEIVVDVLANLEEVEYYKKTISTDEYEYRIYFTTTSRAYLFDATDDDITALKLLAKTNLFEVNEVFVVPFYVDIIVGLIILFLPFGKRRKRRADNLE